MKGSNMKKFIASALVASMLITTPAFAEHRKRDRDHSQQERRKSGCGWLCGAIIGGVVVGALSSDRRERREQEYDNRYYPPDYRYDRRYCVREQIVEWHRGERYIYWQTTCN
jgi:hypothetical protein